MMRKAAAAIATCLVVLCGLAQFPVSAWPAGPEGGRAMAPQRGPTPDNDSEPNQDFVNATLISGSASFGGGVGGGDSDDYFRISLQTGPTADTLEVQLKLEYGRTYLEIMDPSHFILLRDGHIDPKTGVTLKLSFTAFMTGNYFIHMMDKGPCNYTLTTIKGSAPFTGDGDDVPSGATVVVPTGGNIKTYNASSTLENHTDIHDLYKIYLDYSAGVKADVLKAYLTAPITGSFGLQLYASGQYGPLDLTSSEPDFVTMGMNQSMTYSPQAAGDYYLRVWGPVGSGSYSLNISLATGTSDQNDAIDLATSLDNTEAHWYNVTGSLTLGIDQDDYYQISGVVPGQVFNCTLTSQDYDARDQTPNIQISMWNNTKVPIPPDPPEALAKPVAYSNARAQEAGAVYVQLYMTKWAGEYSLSIYTNSPPQIGMIVENISFPENTNNTTIKLANVFSDPEGDPLAFSYEMFGDLPGNLTVDIKDDPDRTVLLTPKAGFRGAGSMSWTATDSSGETATLVIESISVFRINHRPEINSSYTIPPVSIPKGVWDNTTLNMKNIFTDPDNDNMKFTATGNIHIRVSFPLDPQNAVWPTGEVMFLPDQGWTGREDISFTATDFTEEGQAMLTSDPVYVTAEVIEIFQEKITVKAAPTINMDEDTSNSSLFIRDYFSSNIPNDTFAFVYTASNISRLNVTLGADSRLTVRPADDWYGQETLRFKGTCPHGLTGNLSLAVNVAPVNDQPVFSSWSPNATAVTINEGQSQKFKVTPLDEDNTQNQLRMNWSVDGVRVSTSTDYELVAGYDMVAGQQSRIFNLVVTVNDTLSQAMMNWTVTVLNVNRPPRDARITFPPDGSTFDEGAKVHFIGAAADDDNDQLTFKWYDGTKLLGIGADYNATRLKAGRHNITLEVADPYSTVNASIIVKVNAKKSPGFEMAAAAAAAAAALVMIGIGRRRK